MVLVPVSGKNCLYVACQAGMFDDALGPIKKTFYGRNELEYLLLQGFSSLV
jgi:hypothetical protein